MGLTKADKFTEKQNQMARLAKALGHPARIAIIEYLTRAQSCVCGDIVNELPLSQSTVSQHLKELKDAGLIDGEVNPPKVKYCINVSNWKVASELFQNLFKEDFSNINCC